MNGLLTGSGFLRELADMLDTVPGLPEPFTVTAQASVNEWSTGRLTQSERFARVHDVAELLRVPVWTDYRAGRYARYGVGQFSYLLYAGPDRLVDRAPLDSRERERTWVVTRAQDQALGVVASRAAQAAVYRPPYYRDAQQHTARLADALHARGLELSTTTLTKIRQGEGTRVH